MNRPDRRWGRGLSHSGDGPGLAAVRPSRRRQHAVAAALVALVAPAAIGCGGGPEPGAAPAASSSAPSPRASAEGTGPGGAATGGEATAFRVEFSTGRKTTNGFGVTLEPGTDLTGTVSLENSNGEAPARRFSLLALLDGVEAPVLTEEGLPSTTVLGPTGGVPLVVPARLLPRGGHRLTVVLVDAEGDLPSAHRPPFPARPLTYDVAVGADGDVTLATYEPPSPRLIEGAGPLLPFVVDDPESNYLKTRHEPGASPLYAKIGTADKPVTHYVGLIVDGRQRDWVPGRPGLLRVDTPALAALVHGLRLAGLPPGSHRVALVDLPDLDRAFFGRRGSAIGSRTFLVTTS